MQVKPRVVCDYHQNWVEMIPLSYQGKTHFVGGYTGSNDEELIALIIENCWNDCSVAVNFNKMCLDVYQDDTWTRGPGLICDNGTFKFDLDEPMSELEVMLNFYFRMNLNICGDGD